MRIMHYSVSGTGILGKRKSECSYQESNLIPNSDALPLSYRRHVGAIKLGSCDKHPLNNVPFDQTMLSKDH